MNRIAFLAVLALVVNADISVAHNVWCHGACGNPKQLVEFYHQAGAAYKKFSEMERLWQEGNAFLESGVIAEFDSKIEPGKSINPDDFVKSLTKYKELRAKMDEFETVVRKLQQIDATCDKNKLHETTLARILAEGEKLPRLIASGVRYSDAAGVSTAKVTAINNTAGILAAWLSDLNVLKSTLDEVIEAHNNALPLTEKGEFAAVMLSGRNAFGDKMPQFTDMFSAYQRMYVMTVTATIATTMQVYPKGYEWLTK